jgi:hypothetical protein
LRDAECVDYVERTMRVKRERMIDEMLKGKQ